MSSMSTCVFCDLPLDNGEKTVTLQQKGCDGIDRANAILKTSFSTTPGQQVHQKCRRDLCRRKEIRQSENATEINKEGATRLRSEGIKFSFKDQCLFCAQPVNKDQNKRSADVYPVRTFDFQDSIREACNQRDDEWGRQVLDRINFGKDLPAVDAVYHQVCSANFRTLRRVPLQNQEPSPKVQKISKGRPVNTTKSEAFLRTATYFENTDDEQLTVSDLVKKMEGYCEDGESPYSSKYMKKKLLDHFGSRIVISEINGKPDVVTFKMTASEILNDFYNQPREDDLQSRQNRLIKAAATLIMNDIKEKEPNKDMYPDPDMLSSVQENQDFLPASLKLLLTTMIRTASSDIKVCSIGQAIMQAVRPKVILAPLQIGLGIQLHHHFASKYLIDVLNSFGFCSYYGEVLKFESSAAVSQGAYLPQTMSDSMIQFSADNVDHNLHTLDGHDTFHGMGIIASVTPGMKFSNSIPRLDTTADQVVNAGKIDLKYHKLKAEMPHFTLKDLRRLDNQGSTNPLDMLLKISWPLVSPRRSWSGFMQSVQDGEYPGESSIHFLPMIDMNPGDISCIFSTLSFVCTEATRLGVTPVITFDQPLYWKALMIIHNEENNSPLKSIILRLGGFHMQMSFLGSIGHIMQSSGLYEILETIYATNTIEHMLSGKAVSRAVRGHHIVHCALNILILSRLFGITKLDIDRNEEHNADEEIEDEIPMNIQLALQQYADILEGKVPIENIQTDDNIKELTIEIADEFERLSKFPTAKLWLQYMDMVEMLNMFIKAERTGDWKLHLHTITRMLPYFAATGHNLYLKSAYCYVQMMQRLETEHPEMYAKFCQGYHVVRRSDRYWAGISTDLAIEQTLMRSLKTSGGMTRGKGMSEVQRAQWLLSMPACSGINAAMQNIERIKYATSDQHKEASKSRLERDNKDIMTIVKVLEERNPFSETSELRNIETGVTATEEVNVHKSESVGKMIVESMKGQDAFSISFKRSMQIKTLNEKTKVKSQGENLNVSSQLLFQRLITAAKHVTNDVSTIFSHELSNFPSSMFDSSGAMREPQKANLADALWTLGDCSSEYQTSTTDVRYVLDGGSLLHRIPWPKGVTFGRIIDLYVQHVLKYKEAIVVFDGYCNGPSTKDSAHLRRTKGIVGTKVIFSYDTPFKSKKDSFLANEQNKQRFIELLSSRLEQNSIDTVHAENDADTLIVQTAIDSAQTMKTVLVGEDTDLLVLLCYHMTLTSPHNIVFQSEMKQSTKKFKVWDIKKTLQTLDGQLCKALPFIHAISGCDTTSRLFGVGKGQAIKKALTDDRFMEIALSFVSDVSRDEILKRGEEAVILLYNGVQLEGLDLLRFRKFTIKVMTSSKFVEVHTLPPTSDAAKYHVLRTFYQVKQWTGSVDSMDVQEWGWVVQGNLCLPIRSTKPPAPEELLKTIYCRCKTNCDTKRCNCRKHGLECNIACTECQGTNCCNRAVANEEANDESDADD